MTAVRVLAALAALIILNRTLMSAVRTFVVPRDRSTALTRFVFLALRKPFMAVAKRRDPERAHAVMRLYAPLSLLALPGVWVMVTWLCFATFYWAIDETPLVRSLELSGASVTSLGSFLPKDGEAETFLTFIEAALGLGLVALLITYLPTIYAAYQRREREVQLLAVRANTPPSGVFMLRRFHLLGLDNTSLLWTDWEQWFVDLEESHTSMGSLAQFRSGNYQHSWITAAGAVLDAASLLLSSADVPFEPRASLTIRSGFLALRGIADFYNIPYDPDPSPTDPISVTRAEFDAALAELEANGMTLKADRDQAWRDFAGWRVNYDTTLLALCSLVGAAPALWSSDRAPAFRRPPITRRGGRR